MKHGYSSFEPLIWTNKSDIIVKYRTLFSDYSSNSCDQSLQWNVCAAHVNNFSSNLVDRVDFSDSRVALLPNKINNVELKCSFVRCRKYHKS